MSYITSTCGDYNISDIICDVLNECYLDFWYVNKWYINLTLKLDIYNFNPSQRYVSLFCL